ncbi:lanthionine synthetase LanC family protein [Sphaerisporangium corydalis]|uniref:Lanthionine synthetase LanC family protein n=1 Tax=Sphaerisporangium corydalis TaxID=1441875 RepID=A0ABV9EHM4_9ACTN|nr:lanthionine synthetase LanC family protein [Sphaerisporangium corydalis]
MGESAWSWVLGLVRDDDGPWLPEAVPEDGERPAPADDRDSLYAGIGGLAPVLAEIATYRALSDAERDLSARIVARLRAQAAVRAEPSLYDGLAGDAVALKMLDGGGEAVALRRLAELMTPAGWKTTLQIDPGSDAPRTDIISGTAGVVLAAIWAGGEHAETIAATGGEALLRAAERTEAGLDWGMVPGAPSRTPNFSHGTAGVASALAVAGVALGRQDFVRAAERGARHLLTVGSLDGGGFVIPHTIPPSTREVEPVTYTWCHGPAGTSYVFAALAHAGVTEVDGHPVAGLRRRCLDSVLGSGLPRRLRPGFWDNDGRCCGTAGVGEALLDAAQDDPDPARAATLLDAARIMGDALAERAIRDRDGTRWRFVEYRQDPPLLPPGTTWMQGAAGIAAYLLRLARVVQDGLDAPVVDRPDQWWAVPARLRTVHVAPSTAPRS